jgi:hypothetical protein
MRLTEDVSIHNLPTAPQNAKVPMSAAKQTHYKYFMQIIS